jgi:hypothetical protein
VTTADADSLRQEQFSDQIHRHHELRTEVNSMRWRRSTAVAATTVADTGSRLVDDEANFSWTTCHEPDVELDARTTGSIHVRLLWDSSSGRTWVEVTPLGVGERFDVEAAPSLARSVFWHPYAYRNRPMANSAALTAGNLDST